MYYAHSTNDKSRANWQLLPDHLIDTANIAERLGRRIGLAKAARLAGLLHDVGKYTPEFQARLNGAKEGVDHSTAGAAVAQQLAKAAKVDDRLIAELIAYAIAAIMLGLARCAPEPMSRPLRARGSKPACAGSQSATFAAFFAERTAARFVSCGAMTGQCTNVLKTGRDALSRFQAFVSALIDLATVGRTVRTQRSI